MTLGVTLGAVLASRARTDGDATAFIIPRADGSSTTLTFGALHERCLRIAALLREHGARPGDRILLGLPPGPGYVAAFFGCQYAAAVAVPAYPPRRSGHDERLRAVAADAEPVLALGEGRVPPHGPGLRWLPVDAADAVAPLAEPVLAGPDDLAFLQYTSGSTGVPKGVMVAHRAVLANLAMIAANFGLTRADRAVSWLPPYHDMGLVGGVLTPIHAGITCVLLSPVAFAQDPASWLRAVSRFRATVSGGPDFGYRLCVDRVSEADSAGWDLRGWRLAFTGAEPVRAQTLQRFAHRFAGAGFRPEALHPCYGLAEATLIVSGATLGEPIARRERAGAPPLVASGRPLCPVRVVDPRTGLDRPPGEAGEIWVGGPAIASGYWNRPAETAVTFGAWLRTGDLGLLDDGRLFVTGRAKELIIVRGRNLYPHDVEERVVGAHPLLSGQAAAAFDLSDGDGEGLAIAVEADRHADPAALGAALAAARGAVVEATGVDPAVLVAVRRAGLPRTSSGKPRRAETRRRYLDGTLPLLAVGSTLDSIDSTLDSIDSTMDSDGPGADAVATMRGLVEALLPGPVPADEPLTRLGLDSVLAARLVAAAQASGLTLDLEAVLSGATLAELAAVSTFDTAPPLVPLDLLRAFWLHEQRAPLTPAATMAVAVELAAGVDAERLDAALLTLLARHRVLRCRLGPAGVAVYDPVPPRLLDIAAEVEPADRDERLRRLCSPPPQLAAGNLVRATLLPVRGAAPVLLLVAHHAVADARSLRILLGELEAAYAGALAPGPERAPAVARVAARPDDRDWWRARLAGLADRAEFPADRPAPAASAFRGATLRHRLRCDGRALAAAAGVTRFTVLLAAAAVLVARHAGDADVVLGVPVGARDADCADAVGYLVRVVPVRIDLAGAESAGAAVARTGAALAASLARASVAIDELVALAGTGRRPLFDVAVVDDGPDDIAGAPAPGGGLIARRVPVDRGGAAFALSLIVSGDELAVEYDVERFDAVTARRIAGRLDTLLAAMTADPGAPWTALPLCAPDEPRPPVAAPAPPAGGLLHEAVWASAARRPDAVAVRDAGCALTYGQLRARALAVAAELRARGVGPGDRVGLAMPRSVDLIAAMLGVLAAGAAYVPLDPAYPRERNDAILADAAVATVLDAASIAAGPGAVAPVAVAVAVAPDDPAYVCYTSGSTGGPKGVVVEHRHAVASTAARLAYYAGPVERFALLSSPAFDSSVAGIYWTLARGGTLVLAPPGTERDPVAAWRLLVEQGATHTLTLPTLWAAMLEAGAALAQPPLRTVVVAGEECPASLVRSHALALPDCVLVNEYGPTEATVWATAHVAWAGAGAPVPAGNEPVPIGVPVPGLVARVLDPWGNEAPAGVPGELYLGGPQLARGYLHQPDETARRFVTDARHGRLYRTGDRVSRRDDGALRFYGRMDGQLKIRGHRVEPGEVEAVLGRHPAVLTCAVTVHAGRLVAYVVPRGEAGGGPSGGPSEGPWTGPWTGPLRDWLGVRLPAAFVPQAVVALPELPRTPSGKLDRRALPHPQATTRAAGRAPAGTWEEMVAQAFGAVLECGPVGAEDDFFDLGGHSLAAAQVAARLTALTGAAVEVREVFEASTVQALAGRLAGAREAVTTIPRQPRRAT